MKLLVMAASHREDSLNARLATLAARHLESKGITIDLARYASFDMPVYNDAVAEGGALPDIVQSFGKRAAGAQGMVICSPEYNWSYPGSLKNIIDWTSRMKPSPLAGKTALLMSASTGSRGGITGLTHLKTPLEAMQMFVFPRVFALGTAQTAFGPEGLSDQKQQALFISLLNDYVVFANKLVAT
jgi:chromate reductase, NAD(P)H dehydrogenase (quinone)